MGFYIVNAKNMNILFSKPLDINNDIVLEHEKYAKWIIEIYVEVINNPIFGSLEYIKFKNLHILIKKKYNFIFILMRPRQTLEAELKAQMFFYSNLFLNAFHIKDKKAAEDFIKEFETVKKKRRISESLTHSFLIWEALDKHVEAVDTRNMLEAFVNVINALIDGIVAKWEKEQKLNELRMLKKLVEENIKKTKMLKRYYYCSDKKVMLGNDIIVDTWVIEVKKELLELVRLIKNYIKEKGKKGDYWEVVEENMSRTIKMEWYRLQNLGVLKELIIEIWR